LPLEETEILAKEEPAPPPVVPEQPSAPEPEPVPEPAAAAPEPPARKEPPKRGKKTHPIVPSWEDVLLGVRSHRG
jgi:hypothetical protein